MLQNALNIKNNNTVITEAGGGEQENTSLRVYQGVKRLRVRPLLQIRLIFVRDTRGTGIKRLSIHSDDGLNTNFELKFSSALYLYI